MRILIHAPAARMGGARAHVLGLVPQLAQVAPDDQVLLLAQPDLLADLPPLPSSWATRLDRPMGQARRLIWEQRALARLAAEWGADVLLSFGSFVPLRAPCPTVLEAGNALPFTRAYWLRLRDEASLRVRAQELARWGLLRASLRAARRVLAPTRAMRQDVVSALPDLADRVDVAPWGVSDVFHQAAWSDPGQDVLLGVSKHGINKEFDVLVASLVHPALRNVRLRLTGTPDESRWARRTLAAARQLGVGHVAQEADPLGHAQLASRGQRAARPARLVGRAGERQPQVPVRPQLSQRLQRQHQEVKLLVDAVLGDAEDHARLVWLPADGTESV